MKFTPILGLDDKALQRIKTAYPHLKHAEDVTGVPWQMIAAIWRRESNCRDSVAIKGGPMQFDPELTKNQIAYLLANRTKLTGADKIDIQDRGIHDFKAAFIIAACFLLQKCPSLISSHSDDMIKDAFWGYNGRAYGSADHSPYVMNGYDQAHANMIIKGTINGKPIKPVPDRNPGAFVIYKQLKEMFP